METEQHINIDYSKFRNPTAKTIMKVRDYIKFKKNTTFSQISDEMSLHIYTVKESCRILSEFGLVDLIVSDNVTIVQDK